MIFWKIHLFLLNGPILSEEIAVWKCDGCYTLGPFTKSNPGHSICVPNHTYDHMDVFKVKTIDCSITGVNRNTH